MLCCKGELVMINEKDLNDTQEDVKTESVFEHEKAHIKVQEMAKATANQNKEMEKTLYDATEKNNEKAQNEMLSQIFQVIQERKKDVLNHPENVSSDLASLVKSDMEKTMVATAESTMVNTVSQMLEQKENTQEINVEDLSPTFKETYKDTVKLDAKTDVVKDFETSISNQSLGGIFNKISDEIEHKTKPSFIYDSGDKKDYIFNETLNQSRKAEKATYRDAENTFQAETGKMVDYIDGSDLLEMCAGNIEEPDKIVETVSKQMTNVSDDTRKKIEYEVAEEVKKVKEAAKDELRRSHDELQEVNKKMDQLNVEERNISNEGTTVGIALRLGPVAALGHLIRRLKNFEARRQTKNMQQDIQAWQHKLKETSR